MKVTKLILLLSLLPFILTTCKDDEIVTLGPLYLGEAADYIFFEEGSWWKYVNTKTNEVDSTTVSYSYRELQYYGCSENSNFIEKEDFKMRAESSTICRNQKISIDQPWGCRPNNELNHYFQVSVRDGCESGLESVIFYYPFDLEKGGGASQDVIFNEVHDSIQVQSKWYYSVAEFHLDYDPSWGQRKSIYYWAKSIGLIKREQYEHFTNQFIQGWELINHQVIQ